MGVQTPFALTDGDRVLEPKARATETGLNPWKVISEGSFEDSANKDSQPISQTRARSTKQVQHERDEIARRSPSPQKRRVKLRGNQKSPAKATSPGPVYPEGVPIRSAAEFTEADAGETAKEGADGPKDENHTPEDKGFGFDNLGHDDWKISDTVDPAWLFNYKGPENQTGARASTPVNLLDKNKASIPLPKYTKKEWRKNVDVPHHMQGVLRNRSAGRRVVAEVVSSSHEYAVSASESVGMGNDTITMDEMASPFKTFHSTQTSFGMAMPSPGLSTPGESPPATARSLHARTFTQGSAASLPSTAMVRPHSANVIGNEVKEAHRRVIRSRSSQGRPPTPSTSGPRLNKELQDITRCFRDIMKKDKRTEVIREPKPLPLRTVELYDQFGNKLTNTQLKQEATKDALRQMESPDIIGVFKDDPDEFKVATGKTTRVEGADHEVSEQTFAKSATEHLEGPVQNTMNKILEKKLELDRKENAALYSNKGRVDTQSTDDIVYEYTNEEDGEDLPLGSDQESQGEYWEPMAAPVLLPENLLRGDMSTRKIPPCKLPKRPLKEAYITPENVSSIDENSMAVKAPEDYLPSSDQGHRGTEGGEEHRKSKKKWIPPTIIHPNPMLRNKEVKYRNRFQYVVEEPPVIPTATPESIRALKKLKMPKIKHSKVRYTLIGAQRIGKVPKRDWEKEGWENPFFNPVDDTVKRYVEDDLEKRRAAAAALWSNTVREEYDPAFEETMRKINEGNSFFKNITPANELKDYTKRRTERLGVTIEHQRDLLPSHINLEH